MSALTRVRDGSARRGLRLMRKRVLVHTAWQEMQGTSPLVTATLWSTVADACIALADRVAFAETALKFGVIDGARSVLALGKLGSRELNPSSDVDLVCVYRSDDAVSEQGISAHEWFTGWARRLRAILADVDDDGFCFRVDFDLRPEGTQGPLVNSIDAVESYYERFGRTWERAALLRLRPVVDVDSTGSLLVKRLAPFVFQKSLDARIVDELFAMKSQVTQAATARTHGAVQVWDVKRGVGGIREVEFVAQSLQLLHGGRLKVLQGPKDTASTLAALGELGLLPHATTQKLMNGYELLRRVEHALQLAEDQQTQLLPESGEQRNRVAWVCARALHRPGRPVRFEEALATAREDVHDAFVRHLGEDRSVATPSVRLALDPTASDEMRRTALSDLGFSDGPRSLELLRSLERRRGSMLAPSSLRELGARRFVERLLEQLGHSVDPQTALQRFADFFGGRLHPVLLARLDDRATTVIARVLALSAPLSRSLARLARRGGIDDALLFGLNARRPSLPALQRLMRRGDGDGDGDGDDDESDIASFARLQQEQVFATALPFLSGRISVIEAQHRLSVLADALLRAAVDVAARRLRRRHGAVPGLGFAAFALGSLGGHELGFFRDLDLAFVYDTNSADSDDVASTGARSIPASEWAVRMAQQVLWVLTTPTDGAALYPVDTRLRPSGNQGALTTSIHRFSSYHAAESALWERQSLLRLRFVAGDASLGRRVLDVVRRSLARPAPVGLGLRLLDMRARMVDERAAKNGLDVKLGEGGIADVEFAVQGAQLAAAAADPAVLLTSTRRALARLARRGHLRPAEALALRTALDVLHEAREALSLVDDARTPAVVRSDPRLDKLARGSALSGVSDGDAAWRRLVEAMAVIRETSSRILMRLT